MNLFKRGAQLYLTCSDRVRLPVVEIVGVVLGLGAALSWGLADYFAALASRGIGHAIADSYNSFRTAHMYGLILGLGLCVVLINTALRALSRRLTAAER